MAPSTDLDALASSTEGSGATGAVPAPLEYPELVSDQPQADRPLKPSPAATPFAENAVAVASTPRSVTPAAVPSKAPAAARKAPVAQPAAKPSGSPPAAASATAGAGGFQVQVAAYQRQGDASTVRDRLARKGYPAFVTTATTAAGTWFRVRVGGYDTRNEAQEVAARLKREEQLEPWVTR